MGDSDADEFAGLTLKTSNRRPGQPSKARPIAPPPAGPTSKPATTDSLLVFDDLLTGDVAAPAPVSAPMQGSKPSTQSSDIDLFLDSVDVLNDRGVGTVDDLLLPTPATATTTTATKMSDADFDSFLNSISTK